MLSIVTALQAPRVILSLRRILALGAAMHGSFVVPPQDDTVPLTGRERSQHDTAHDAASLKQCEPARMVR
jgi:hypothetical protein